MTLGLHIVKSRARGDKPVIWYVYAWRGGPCVHRSTGVRPNITRKMIERAAELRLEARRIVTHSLCVTASTPRRSIRCGSMSPSGRPPGRSSCPTSVSSATWTGNSTSCHSTRTCSSRSAPMGSGYRSSHRSTGGPIVRLGLSEPQLMWFEPVAKHERVNRYRNAGGAALLTPRLKLGFRSDLDAQCGRHLLCLLGF